MTAQREPPRAPANQRVQPQHLIVECEFCGGNKTTKLEDITPLGFKIDREIICAHCGGEGWRFPKKAHK